MGAIANREDVGGRLRGVAGHAVTALVTLALAMLWVDARDRGRAPQAKGPVLAQVPGPGRRPAPPRAATAAEAPPPSPTAAAALDTPPSLPTDVLRGLDPGERVNVEVYEAANRGVVNITTAESAGLFGDEVTSGTGSGFVLDRDGHILTNFHVIEGAEAVQVTFFDGSTHPAEVIGVDPTTDVAVVKVDLPAEQLWPLPLGDSTNLLVGQKVLALGNPFGLERTLTTGIISSLDRTLKALNGRTIKGIIQTDAAINPGNSGGPLLDARGRVIGMNTAIISQVGQSAGIGFSVPISAIRRILKPLIEVGRVIRADLGVRKVFSTDRGLLVLQLYEGGPADQAGVRPMQVRVERLGPYIIRKPDPETADLIVAVDGKPVRNVDELLTAVEAHAPGETATLTIVRDGRTRKIPVRLGQS